MTENTAWLCPDKLTLVNWSKVSVESNSGWAHLLSEDTGMEVRLPVEPDLVRRFRGVGGGRYDLVPGYSNEAAAVHSLPRSAAPPLLFWITISKRTFFPKAQRILYRSKLKKRQVIRIYKQLALRVIAHRRKTPLRTGKILSYFATA